MKGVEREGGEIAVKVNREKQMSMMKLQKRAKANEREKIS